MRGPHACDNERAVMTMAHGITYLYPVSHGAALT
jgi:hypothetical protein